MAKALGTEATDITYKKYYAEYCAMHNLGTPKHKHVDSCEEDNGQIECAVRNTECSEIDVHNENRNGKNETKMPGCLKIKF